MTETPVVTLAQTPVPNLTKRWGETVHETRRQVAQLEASLGELAKIKDTLAEHGLTVATDLGPTGNAAAAAFATTQNHKADHAAPTFSLTTERGVA